MMGPIDRLRSLRSRLMQWDFTLSDAEAFQFWRGALDLAMDNIVALSRGQRDLRPLSSPSFLSTAFEVGTSLETVDAELCDFLSDPSFPGPLYQGNPGVVGATRHAIVPGLIAYRLHFGRLLLGNVYLKVRPNGRTRFELDYAYASLLSEEEEARQFGKCADTREIAHGSWLQMLDWLQPSLRRLPGRGRRAKALRQANPGRFSECIRLLSRTRLHWSVAAEAYALALDLVEKRAWENRRKSGARSFLEQGNRDIFRTAFRAARDVRQALPHYVQARLIMKGLLIPALSQLREAGAAVVLSQEQASESSPDPVPAPRRPADRERWLEIWQAVEAEVMGGASVERVHRALQATDLDVVPRDTETMKRIVAWGRAGCPEPTDS